MPAMLKVICVDNYARDSVPDVAVTCYGLTYTEAKAICRILQDSTTRSDDHWFQVVPFDYVLSRGLADII